MRPEPFAAFHQALRFGPGYCPPDQFEGSIPAIVRGLKVHANNISHARHIAIEDTYPRLLRRMGPEAFHAVAEQLLDRPHAFGRSLDGLGEGFEQLLDDPAHRDLARVEWAWLEAFHAAEGNATTLADLALMTPEALLASHFTLHPASRWMTLEEPDSFTWEGPVTGDGNVLLLTRPDAALAAARAGRGLVTALSYQVNDDLAAGKLVCVLESFEPDPLPVQLIWPDGRDRLRRVRMMIDHLVKELQGLDVLRSR